MDWNQISNYAARHTHTKSWGWGTPGRPAGPYRTPVAMASEPRAKCSAWAPGRLGPGPGAPARAWGRFQFRLGLGAGAGAALRPEGTQEEGGRSWPPPRKDFPGPCGCGPSCPSLSRGPGGRTHGAPYPLGPQLTALGETVPQNYRFARNRCDWAPGCGTHTNKLVSSQSEASTHTHADTCRTLQGPRFPIPAAPGPDCGHFSPAGTGKNERGQKPDLRRPGCFLRGPGVTLYPQPCLEIPK